MNKERAKELYAFLNGKGLKTDEQVFYQTIEDPTKREELRLYLDSKMGLRIDKQKFEQSLGFTTEQPNNSQPTSPIINAAVPIPKVAAQQDEEDESGLWHTIKNAGKSAVGTVVKQVGQIGNLAPVANPYAMAADRAYSEAMQRQATHTFDEKAAAARRVENGVGSEEDKKLGAGILTTNRINQAQQEYAKEARKNVGEDATFTGLIKEGKIGDALELGLITAIESAPQMLMGGNALGRVMLGTLTAADEYDRLAQEKPEMSVGARAAQAVLHGAVEQFWESFGLPQKVGKKLAKSGGMLGRVFKSTPEGSVSEMIGRWAKKGFGEKTGNLMQKVGKFLGSWAKEMTEEGLEEVMTSLSNQVFDTLIGAMDENGEGLIKEFRAMKEQAQQQGKDYTFKDFAWDVAVGYANDFLGGALAGGYMGGAAGGINVTANAIGSNLVVDESGKTRRMTREEKIEMATRANILSGAVSEMAQEDGVKRKDILKQLDKEEDSMKAVQSGDAIEGQHKYLDRLNEKLAHHGRVTALHNGFQMSGDGLQFIDIPIYADGKTTYYRVALSSPVFNEDGSIDIEQSGTVAAINHETKKVEGADITSSVLNTLNESLREYGSPLQVHEYTPAANNTAAETQQTPQTGNEDGASNEVQADNQTEVRNDNTEGAPVATGERSNTGAAIIRKPSKSTRHNKPVRQQYTEVVIDGKKVGVRYSVSKPVWNEDGSLNEEESSKILIFPNDRNSGYGNTFGNREREAIDALQTALRERQQADDAAQAAQQQAVAEQIAREQSIADIQAQEEQAAQTPQEGNTEVMPSQSEAEIAAARIEEIYAGLQQRVAEGGTKAIQKFTNEEKFVWTMRTAGIDAAVEDARGYIEDAEKIKDRTERRAEIQSWQTLIEQYTPAEVRNDDTEGAPVATGEQTMEETNTTQETSNETTEENATQEQETTAENKKSTENLDNSEKSSTFVEQNTEGYGRENDTAGNQPVAGRVQNNTERTPVSDDTAGDREGGTGSEERHMGEADNQSSRMGGDGNHVNLLTEEEQQLNSTLNNTFAQRGLEHNEQGMHQVGAQQFYDAIVAAKEANPNGWMVDAHEVSDYEADKCFLSEDGSFGIAVTQDGDIISVFSNGTQKHVMEKAMLWAIANGGNKLDCYVANGKKHLANLYARFGFEVASTTPFAEGDWLDAGYPAWKEQNPNRVPKYVAAMYLPLSFDEVIKNFDGSRTVDVTAAPVFEGEKGYGNMLDYRNDTLQQKLQERQNEQPSSTTVPNTQQTGTASSNTIDLRSEEYAIIRTKNGVKVLRVSERDEKGNVVGVNVETNRKMKGKEIAKEHVVVGMYLSEGTTDTKKEPDMWCVVLTDADEKMLQTGLVNGEEHKTFEEQINCYRRNRDSERAKLKRTAKTEEEIESGMAQIDADHTKKVQAATAKAKQAGKKKKIQVLPTNYVVGTNGEKSTQPLKVKTTQLYYPFTRDGNVEYKPLISMTTDEAEAAHRIEVGSTGLAIEQVKSVEELLDIPLLTIRGLRFFGNTKEALTLRDILALPLQTIKKEVTRKGETKTESYTPTVLQVLNTTTLDAYSFADKNSKELADDAERTSALATAHLSDLEVKDAAYSQLSKLKSAIDTAIKRYNQLLEDSGMTDELLEAFVEDAMRDSTQLSKEHIDELIEYIHRQNIGKAKADALADAISDVYDTLYQEGDTSAERVQNAVLATIAESELSEDMKTRISNKASKILTSKLSSVDVLGEDFAKAYNELKKNGRNTKGKATNPAQLTIPATTADDYKTDNKNNPIEWLRRSMRMVEALREHIEKEGIDVVDLVLEYRDRHSDDGVEEDDGQATKAKAKKENTSRQKTPVVVRQAKKSNKYAMEIAQLKNQKDLAIDMGENWFADQLQKKIDELEKEQEMELQVVEESNNPLSGDEMLRSAGKRMVEAVRKAGVDIKVISQAKLEAQLEHMRKKAELAGDKSKSEYYTELRTKSGKVYGFATNGRIVVVEERMNPNTPLHEYTHLWVAAYTKADPKKWAHIVELLQHTKMWQDVMNDPNYSAIRENEQAVASEVFARLCGEHWGAIVDSKGTTRFDELLAQEETLGGKATLIHIRKAIEDFVRTILEWWNIHIHKTSRFNDLIEHTLRMPMEELARWSEAVHDIESEANQERLEAMLTYHGTTAKFDKFDFTFMGSGEGAQAYGWGAYVSESEGVAISYASDDYKRKRIKITIGGQIVSSYWLKDNYPDADMDVMEKVIYELDDAINSNNDRYNPTEAVRDHLRVVVEEMLQNGNSDISQEVANILSSIAERIELQYPNVARRLYEVEIPDDTDSNYLRWEDKVPQEEIRRIFSEFIKQYPGRIEIENSDSSYLLGGELYRELEDMISASQEQSIKEELQSLVEPFVFKDGRTGIIISTEQTIIESIIHALRYQSVDYIIDMMLAPGVGDFSHIENFRKNDAIRRENRKRIVAWLQEHKSEVNQDVAHWKRTDKQASEFLYSIGYTGVTMPIGHHSGKQSDKRNYVLFNEDDLVIVRRTEFDMREDDATYGLDDTKSAASQETDFDKKFKKIAERLDKGGANVLSLQTISNLTDALENDLRQGNRPILFERIPYGCLQKGLEKQRNLAEALTLAAFRSRRASRKVERDGKVVTSEEIVSRDGSNTQMELDLRTYAIEKGIWYDDAIAAMDERLGKENRIGRGQESQVWADKERGVVVKAKSTQLYETLEEFFEGMVLNNWLFEDSKQHIIGYGYDQNGMFRVIYETPYVEKTEFREMTDEEKDAHMARFGFTPTSDSHHIYSNGIFEVRDMHNQNIVVDANGTVRVTDPIVKWEAGEHYRMPTPEEEAQDARNEEFLDDLFDNDDIEYQIADGDVLDIDAYTEKRIQQLSKDINVVAYDTKVPMPERLDKTAKLINTMLDRTEGIRQLQMRMNAIRQKMGLKKLSRAQDVRSMLERSEAAISGKHVLFEQRELKDLMDYLYKNKKNGFGKRIKDSALYAKYKTEKYEDADGNVQERELSVEEFIGRYLIARDTIERISLGIPPRGVVSFKKRMGVDMVEFAKEFIDEYGLSDVAELHRRIKAITDLSISSLREAGILSEEQYAIYQQRKFYVPEKGFDEQTASEKSRTLWERFKKDVYDLVGIGEITPDKISGGKQSVRPLATSYRARGGDSLATDIFAHIVQDCYDAIQKAEQNKVKLAMYNLLKENTDVTHALKLPIPEEVYYVKDENGEWVRKTDGVTAEEKEEAKAIMAQVHLLELEASQETDMERRNELYDTIDELLAMMPYADEYTTHNVFQTQQEKNLEKVGVWVNGVLQEMRFPNMVEVANALNGRFDTRKNLSVARDIGNVVASLCTQYNPTFFAVNVVRDVPFILGKGATEYGVDFLWHFGKQIVNPENQKAIISYLNGKLDETAGEANAAFYRFITSGGQTGYSRVKELNAIRDKLQEWERKGTAVGFVNTMEAFSKLNEWSELWTRFSIYRAILAAGMNEEEALHAAKNLSVNFNRRGFGAPALNALSSLSMFANATIQGASGFYRTFGGETADGKSKAGKIARGVTLLMVLPAVCGFIATLLTMDDDEEEEKIPAYERDNNICIGNWRIALNEQMKPFWLIGVNAAMLIKGKRTKGEALTSLITACTTNLLPLPPNVNNTLTHIGNMVGGEDISIERALRNLWMPQGLQGMNAIAEGKDWLGNSLRLDIGDVPEFTTRENESAIYRDLAYFSYCLGGGRTDVYSTYKKNGEKIPDFLNRNPKEIKNNLFFTMMPSGWRNLLEVGWGLGHAALTEDTIGESIRPKDIPLANRFYKPSDPKAYRANVYIKCKNEIKSYYDREAYLKKQAKGGNAAAREELQALRYEMGKKHIPALKGVIDRYNKVSLFQQANRVGLDTREFKRKNPKMDFENLDNQERELIQQMLYYLNSTNGTIETVDSVIL